MSGEELVALVCCDLGAVVRGRSLLLSDLDSQRGEGVGWVPANHALTPLNTLAQPNPFGSTGDLRLLPDGATRTRIEASDGDERAALDFVLCDIVEIDGEPWRCCPRQFLRAALAEIEAELDARISTSFEHEFQLLDDEPPPLAFSLDAQRRAEPFATRLMNALVEAGVEPERFLPEYAAHQFEIPLAPADGLAGADRAIAFREVVRDVARSLSLRASFVPLLEPAEAGNGVHVHLNLLDAGGRSLFYDAAARGGISELGSQFAAGIIRHARALSALTAPSPVSGARLTPHRWSAGAMCLGLRNREALLRIPPLATLGRADPARQMRLEYRGADATANPYLVLGALLRAGLAGVRERLPAPPLLEADPAELGSAEAARFGVGGLPGSLAEALEALEQDALVRRWLTPPLYEAYASVKQAEVEAARDEDLRATCRRYAAIY